jgi:hypothetical protein
MLHVFFTNLVKVDLHASHNNFSFKTEGVFAKS